MPNGSGFLKIPGQHVARDAGSLSCDWPTLIQQATEHALEHDHKLLVVDTFPGLAGLAGEEENDAGAVTGRLRHLQQAARAGLAVLFLHHMNRYGQARGSSAFSGMADISVSFNREGQSRRFSLVANSRYIGTPSTWKGQLVRGIPDRYESLNSMR